MLRIHDTMLHVITIMRPMLSAIERRDSDLARQLRRCAASVVLNVAEGSGSFGRVTLSDAYRFEGLPAGAGKERDRVVLRMTHNNAIDHFRKKLRSVPIEPEAQVEDVLPVLAQAVDAVADRDELAKVFDVPVKKLQAARCYARFLCGDSLRKIAEEEQLPYDTVRKRVAKIEKYLRERATKIRKFGRVSGVLAMLLAMGLGSWRMRPPPGMALDEPGAVAVLEPAVSTHVGEVDAKDWARVIRGEAFRACMENRWRACLDGLVAARDLDPEGDDDPAVQAAKLDALDGIDSKTNRFPPGHVRPYASKASR